jgi:hypothetical protein
MSIYHSDDASETPADVHSDTYTGRFGLPDDVRAEMDSFFGYDAEESPDEVEAHYQAWLARDNAERELADAREQLRQAARAERRAQFSGESEAYLVLLVRGMTGEGAEDIVDCAAAELMLRS